MRPSNIACEEKLADQIVKGRAPGLTNLCYYENLAVTSTYFLADTIKYSQKL